MSLHKCQLLDSTGICSLHLHPQSTFNRPWLRAISPAPGLRQSLASDGSKSRGSVENLGAARDSRQASVEALDPIRQNAVSSSDEVQADDAPPSVLRKTAGLF
eukprot:6187376-Pleurochrysis_carterae.AAC.2